VLWAKKDKKMFSTKLKPKKDLTATVYKAGTFCLPALGTQQNAERSTLYALRSTLNPQNSTLNIKDHHAEDLHYSGSLPDRLAALCAGKET
jgi:hypothetical protein